MTPPFSTPDNVSAFSRLCVMRTARPDLIRAASIFRNDHQRRARHPDRRPPMYASRISTIQGVHNEG